VAARQRYSRTDIPIAGNRTSAEYLITSPLPGRPDSAHAPLDGRLN
jgi:hypothetical protein